jgi:hypothetical protein
MAPTKFNLKSFHRSCIKQQKASGRGWTTSFPHDRLKQEAKSVDSDSRVIKASAQPPTKFYMTADELIEAAQKEADAKSALSASGNTNSVLAAKSIAAAKTSAVKPIIVKPAATVKSAATSKPVTAKSATVKPATVKPATVKPATVKPVAIKSATIKPTTFKSNIVKPKTVKLPPTKSASTSRKDSLSPVPTAPKGRAALLREDSGINLNSSSSATSVKGVHLHLATTPPARISSWIADWMAFCRLSKDHIEAYYSTIETTTSDAGLIVYADCDNKLMANLLKSKLAGDKILGTKLICRII